MIDSSALQIKCNFHLLSGVEDRSGQRDQPKMEKEISASGSEGAAEKSQCLYNQKDGGRVIRLWKS